MTVLLIDNYDSFAHNLARYIRELGRPCLVVRNDAVSLAEVARLAPSHIVVSPGPCTPNEAGVSNAVVDRFGATVPLLGVCLGHQCIGQVFGARVLRAKKPMHGKTSLLHHRGDGLFAGLPSPFRITRYHSLVVAAEGLPDGLEATAVSDEGEIMALRHRRYAIFGLQFHPEAVLTEHGHALLANFLGIGAAEARPDDAA